MLKIIGIFLFLTFIGPIWLWITGQVSMNGNWKTAERSSAHLAPGPETTPEAVVQIYAARAFNWRGLFSVHTWIAAKPANASHYEVYQVIGWLLLAKQPVVSTRQDVPDRLWFGVKPTVLLDLRGEKAAQAIPQLQKAAAEYPYANSYHVWPGPNSNTFIAYLIRKNPELAVAMPSNAVGKDYLGDGRWFAKAPSGTGYQISLFGLLGLLIAKEEGIELNFLGVVYGINPWRLNISLPGIGTIGKK